MARERVIVSIGEALLCEYPDRVEPGGLAVNMAWGAARLGHRGVIVSRIGQDAAADTLLRQLKERQLATDHIQSDPDLATGRLIVRSLAGKVTQTLTPRAAFDNLQWDFDLVDVAQQADAVVFGALARREGQSRSIIKRFLAECLNAVRVFDMTNRAGDVIDRNEARSGLELAEGLIADSPALKALSPGWDGKDMRSAAEEIMRASDLTFVIGVDSSGANETFSAHTTEASWAGQASHARVQHEMSIVGLLHGLLNGWDFPKSLEMSQRAATHAAERPDETMETELQR